MSALGVTLELLPVGWRSCLMFLNSKSLQIYTSLRLISFGYSIYHRRRTQMPPTWLWLLFTAWITYSHGTALILQTPFFKRSL